MARIIYGVCGDGSGHATRSKEILDYLKSRKHKLIVIGYGKSYEYLKSHFKTYKIEGLRVIFENNRVRHLKTLMDNMLKSRKHYKSFLKIRQVFKKFRPDMVFTDFESLTSLIATYQRIPLISIDNQAVLTRTKLVYPKKYKLTALMAEGVVKPMVPRAKVYIITTFFKSKIKNKSTLLVPPIVRASVRKLKPEKKNHILVYQTSESNKKLPGLLKKINQKFIIYGFNIAKKDKNLIFRKFSKTGFLDDLKNCKALITNGGLTLITEALHLGKPILSEPIKGQFEQIINAVYLQKLGYGKHEDRLTAAKIKDFIRNLPAYEKNIKKYPREGNEKLFKKIDALIEIYAKD